MSWEKVRLGDYAKVISGFAFKSADFQSGKGIPVLKIGNIQREYVDFTETYYISNEFLSIADKFHVNKRDILISLTGSNITLPNSVVGRVAMYRSDFTSLLNQRAGKVMPLLSDELDNSFLYYYLCDSRVRREIAMFGQGGANQCNISPTNVESIYIPLPDIDIQRKIGSILSVYDDLIENNNKRIKLLEEAAQNIYKEWFVHFRFPGYEKAKFENGLPKGWRKEKVGNLVNIVKGRKPQNELDTPSPSSQLYLLVDVLERKMLRYTEDEKLPQCELGETLMLMDGSRSGAVFKGINGAIGSTLAVFKADKECISDEYCYQFFKSREKEISQKNTGAAIPHANKSYIIGMDIVVPSKQVLEAFGEKLASMNGLIENLHSQIQNLKEARDILLPRLMNGEIEVDATIHELEEA